MKRYILLLIVLCCISCSKSPKCYYVVKQNEGIFYKNYSIPKVLPFSTALLSEKYNIELFDVDKISNKVDLKTKSQRLYRFILNEYLSSAEQYYKDLKKDKYMGIDVDTTYQDVKLYFCGRRVLIPKVESFIFLKQTPNNWNKFRPNRSLLLYNVKGNRLCSIISLSEKSFDVETLTNSKSYYIGIGSFSRISIGLGNTYIPEDILSKLKKNEKDSKVLCFSNFRINGDGMIEFNMEQ